MYTLLSALSIGFVVLGSVVILCLLRRTSGWLQRRRLQFFVLLMPVITIGLAASWLHCLTDLKDAFAPPWDCLSGVVLPLGIAVVAWGALVLGFVRLRLIRRVFQRYEVIKCPPPLQRRANKLARALQMERPQVKICRTDRPLALVYGMWRPTILLSTWMLKRLDTHELEGVLAHELSHIAHRDYALVWLATILRDAFFYLPTSRAAYRQLQWEKEMACDDRAVSLTARPLALASALTKVWLHMLDSPCASSRLGLAQSLTNEGTNVIHGRIERLLARKEGELPSQEKPKQSIAALLAWLFVQGTNMLIILTLATSNPSLVLRRWL